MTTRVYVEAGAKRVFACALDWPGWCRAAKSEDAALEALAAYADRYAVVARAAGEAFAPGDLVVVERVPGDASTDFGVPGAVPAADAAALDAAEAARLAGLLDASWRLLDDVAAGAPAELRKGPRGGGRDRDKMLTHVLEAESAYARSIGVRIAIPAYDDRAAVEAARAELLAVLSQESDGTPLAGRKWPARYAVRRMAWHVLDHAWEMQDRST